MIDAETPRAALTCMSESAREAARRAIRERWPTWFGDDGRALVVPAGWYDLVTQLCERIEGTLPPGASDTFRVAVASEKFGRLRFLWRVPSGHDMGPVNEVVEAAARASALTCQRCGRPGETYDDKMPVETLCARHRAEDQVVNELCAGGARIDAAGRAVAARALREWWPGIVTATSEIEVPDGWADLAVEMVGRVWARVPEGVSCQVESLKYFRVVDSLSLRPALLGASPGDVIAIRAFISRAMRGERDRFLSTCEACGREAERSACGWWRQSLCLGHLDEWAQRHGIRERVAARQQMLIAENVMRKDRELLRALADDP